MVKTLLDALKRSMSRLGSSGRPNLEGADLLVVGLGNPGPEYEGTRHNAGASAVRLLAKRYKVRLRRVGRYLRAAKVDIAIPDGYRGGSDNGDGGGASEVGAGEVSKSLVSMVLAIPTTFMNESGIAVRRLLERANGDAGQVDNLVVIHDDVDLPLGTVRVKLGGGSAGHRGVESIVKSLGTNGFQRIRIGIGRPPEGVSTADWVLSPFEDDQKPLAEEAIGRAAEAAISLAVRGIAATMNIYNSDRTTPSEGAAD